MICERIYASAPTGTLLKKSPASIVTRSLTPLAASKPGGAGYDMWPVEQDAARAGMMGKNAREHVAGSATDVSNGLEGRKIVSSRDGWRFLIMETDHHLAEQRCFLGMLC